MIFGCQTATVIAIVTVTETETETAIAIETGFVAGTVDASEELARELRTLVEEIEHGEAVVESAYVALRQRQGSADP